MKKKLFINNLSITDNSITITGKELHYIKNVLRAEPGDIIEITDSQNNELLQSRINKISKDQIEAVIESRQQVQPSIPLELTLIQGIPKSKKMDLIIQKCTEIGVNSFYPAAFKRNVADISHKTDKKQQRWQKIAREAAKQSGNIRIPDINKPVKIENIKNIYDKHDINLVLWEEENKTTLKKIIGSRNLSNTKSISLTIGPEGGFEHSEVQKLQEAGGVPVSLGSTILRTETAGIAASSMIIYQFLL